MENKSDSCLLSTRSGTGITLIGIYVDDFLVLGNAKDIDQLIVDLRLKVFLLNVERNLKDYLNFQVVENIKKREVLILQPDLINKIIEKFGNEVSDKGIYGTPGILNSK